MINLIRGLLAAAFVLLPAHAAELFYRLEPVEVGPGCYLLKGSNDYFTPKNGGNITCLNDVARFLH